MKCVEIKTCTLCLCCDIYGEKGGKVPYLLKHQENHLSYGKIIFFLSSTFKKENIISLY